jgi:crotonobetainyl-CoA:carnitine CoA-transferase CaiB-like acyl-CoA transferase
VDADVPVAPVKTLEEVVQDPHVVFREMIQEKSLGPGESSVQVNFPVRLFDTPATIRMPPPELGEHNGEILQWLGYSPNQIERFGDEGVI